MDMTPLSEIWSTPVSGKLVERPQKCTIAPMSVDPRIGLEFASPIDPCVVPWNDASPIQYAAPKQAHVLFAVSNPTRRDCLVRALLTDDFGLCALSDVRTVAAGEGTTFDPDSFAQANDSTGGDSFGFRFAEQTVVKAPRPHPLNPEGSDARTPRSGFPRDVRGGVTFRLYVRPLVTRGSTSWTDALRMLASTCFSAVEPPSTAGSDVGGTYVVEAIVCAESGLLGSEFQGRTASAQMNDKEDVTLFRRNVRF